MVISRTPLRLSFFGGGTDYPDYFRRKPCSVLGTTIDKYIFVTINKGSPFFDHRIRLSYSKTETVNRVGDIGHPSVRETLKFLKIDELLDIHIFADLPAKTGLGSSSAFTVCFLNACHAHTYRFVSKQRLAEEAIHIEQELLQENVGIQDQMHAAHGGMNVIRANEEKITATPIIIAPENKQLLEKSLLLFYTRLTRSANEVVSEQLENTRRCTLDPQLKRMCSQVDEAQEILAGEHGEKMLKRFGALLNESWELKKQLSTKISNDSIDQHYAQALKHGALGGKIGGAGAGGFLMLVVEEKWQASVRAALRNLAEVVFNFEDAGATIIYSSQPPCYIQTM